MTLTGQHGGIAEQAQIDDAQTLVQRERERKAAEDAAEAKRVRAHNTPTSCGRKSKVLVPWSGYITVEQIARLPLYVTCFRWY